MAVTKLWSVTERLGQVIDYATNPEKTSAKIKREFSPEQYQALADVIAYAKDEEKTEREFYVEGINCNVAIARDQFITVKEQYQKTDGIQAYHGYLSFKETDISPEMAQKIGMEFANEVWGKRFQVVVTTHLNTKHLHCHFVINSISFVDGKHLWGEEKAWFKFRKVADRICEKYGLYYDPNPNRSKQSDYLTMKEKAGMPTRYSVAKEAIDYAIDHSKTLKEFQFALKEMGYAYNLSPSRKYWTVIPKGYVKSDKIFDVDASYQGDKVKVIEFKAAFENAPIKVEISKTDITGEKELPGAKLSVIDADGKLVESWTSEAGKTHMIERLPVGKYTLREESAPYGYKVASDVTFEVKETAEIQKVSMKDEQAVGKIVIEKTDKVTGKPIEGVVFEVRDKDGKVLDTLTTDKNGHAESKELPICTYNEDGTFKEDIHYTVVETKAADGYILDETAHDVTLRYDDNAPDVVVATLKLVNVPTEPKLPQTGDNANPLLYLGIGALALITGVGVGLRGRKKKNKQ
ncbi:relaxase/mobilization nuclease domain-containing protein [Agathobacter rectalis]